jgi:hypothetical protein
MVRNMLVPQKGESVKAVMKASMARGSQRLAASGSAAVMPLKPGFRMKCHVVFVSAFAPPCTVRRPFIEIDAGDDGFERKNRGDTLDDVDDGRGGLDSEQRSLREFILSARWKFTAPGDERIGLVANRVVDRNTMAVAVGAEPLGMAYMDKRRMAHVTDGMEHHVSFPWWRTGCLADPVLAWTRARAKATG